MLMRGRVILVLVLAFLMAAVLGSPVAAGPAQRTSYWPTDYEVWPGSSIGVQFAEQVDTASVEAAFSLQPEAPGQFVWQDNRFAFEYRPNEPLAAKTRYTVTIDNTARSARGRALFERPLVWSFETAADNGQVRFGYGIPIQFVPVSVKGGVLVYPSYPRVSLDFSLYELDIPGFAAAYPELVDGDDDYAIPVAGLRKVASWRAYLEEPGREVPLPVGTAAGLYVIEAGSSRLTPGQAILIVSDIMLVAKAGREGRTVWVAQLPEATPVTGATVVLRDAQGAALEAKPSDPDGIATFTSNVPALFATGELAGQTSLVVMDAYWTSGYSYYWRWWGGTRFQPPEFVGHVHTDRPIYRPGHTVHYKATVRHIERYGYSVVDGALPITVRIKDNQGNTVFTGEKRADAFGSIGDQFVLGTDVGLGQWQIEVSVGEATFSCPFQVQEYVKPDYEVTVSTSRPHYVRGDRALVTVAARYYFGQPVAQGEVTLRVYRGYYYWYSRTGNQVAELQGTLDAEGRWTGQVVLEGNPDYSESYFFEAEVMDANRRPVVQETAVLVHPASFQLTLSADRYGLEAGQPLVLTAETVDHDGRPVAGRTVNLMTYGYDRNGQRLAHRAREVTGPDGRAKFELRLAVGWFSIEGTAVDEAGRTARAWSYCWFYSPRQPWYWWGGLEVATDKESYQPGETALVVIKSPLIGKALLTLEREEVIESRLIEVDGGTTIEVPIRAEYAPNVWAVVQMWDTRRESGGQTDAQFLMASVNLVVPAETERLAVTIEPDASQHGPREEAQFVVRVRDAQGLPVEAQLSFALVDKAVLALADDASGDIFDAFWRSRDNGVATHDTLAVERSYGRGLPDLAPAPGGRDGEKAGQGQEPPSETSPRREFPDTAFWRWDLVTDAQGQAVVDLTLPDSLTTWVAVARAITKDTKAGQGSAELLVTKSIIADPALPRFAVQGDQFALDVLSRNYTDHPTDGTVGLETPGLVQLDPGTRELSLGVGETRLSRWTVVASSLGEGLVTARLNTTAGGDAIELPLPVVPFSVPDRFVRAGTAAGEAGEAFEVPFNAIPDSSTVEVRLAPSVALGVLDGLEELIGYPYGCIEQTMSRMMPNAVIGRLVSELDIQAPEITTKLPPMMSMGLQKIYSYQNSDGSWGWWRGDGNLYISTYVLHGLWLTQESGYLVDSRVLERGYGYLKEALPKETDRRLQAYAVYVLALADQADAAVATRLFDYRRDMDAFSLAALAIALQRVERGDLAERAMDDLVSRVVETPTTASWPLPGDATRWDSYRWRTMASTEKNTAMALEALALLRPQSPLAAKAARWLMENRWGWSGGWSSTQATAFAILSLTDYLVTSGELWSEFDWSVVMDGRELAAGRVDATNVRQRIAPLVLRGTELTPGEHQLTIITRGRGQLYYTVVGRMALYYEGFAPATAQGFGLSLKRLYEPVSGRSDAQGWHAGDVVNVRLTLTTTEDLHYLVIEDQLPAGFEALNEQLNTESRRVESPPWLRGRWYWWGYERKEVRDQKVTFFASYLPAGEHVFDYAVRVVTPGVFSARPAEAWAMYRPEVWARSASDQVSVDPERIRARPPLAGDFDRDCRLTAFDASLVADAWTGGGQRDVNGDGRLDVADIAIAAGRRGLVCGDTVPLPPGPAGAVTLQLAVPGAVREGETFEVEIWLEGTGNVGGFETTLAWPGGAFEVVGVKTTDFLPTAVSLLRPGDAGVRLGGYALEGRELAGRSLLARLTLRARHSGEAEVEVTQAQVVTDKGGEYEVTANGTVISPEPWRPVGRLYLPIAHTAR